MRSSASDIVPTDNSLALVVPLNVQVFWRQFHMGLLTIVRKLRQRERDVRVLVLGLDNAGKTTVTRRLNGQSISDVAPTLSFNIVTLEHEGMRLNLWDIGGQKSLRPFWRNYFEETDAIVWVVDSTALFRLEEVKQELMQVAGDERMLGASVLVLANKADLTAPDMAALEALVAPLRSSHHCALVPCSAVTGEGLAQAMQWLTHDISDRVFFD